MACPAHQLKPAVLKEDAHECRAGVETMDSASRKEIVYPTRKSTVNLNLTDISSSAELDRLFEAGDNAAIRVSNEQAAKEFLSRQECTLTNQTTLTESQCQELADYLEIKVTDFKVPLKFGGGHCCVKCARELSWLDFAHLAIEKKVHPKSDLAMLLTGEYEGKYMHFAFGGKFWLQCYGCNEVNDLPKEQVRLLGASVRYIL